MIAANDIAAARRRRLVRQGLTSPLIGEIVEALLTLGGQASASLVADTVALRRGGRRASAALVAELALALELHRGHAASLDLPEMITVGPKGWALTGRAHLFLRRGLRNHVRG
ncbi:MULTISPECIES: hypothetical protein [Caulobacter]|uniref:Uncharacterized protein n=1 Tax=Caulobacter vibrioides OR37 TaxID=1292034 RepID=R0E8K4_CAUVI|nr:MULTISPECIES: hypothetical protein [Caulobacter]ENZ81818.1 hypothetical protein OR37_02245 [Caulobacter vibrioides OR37]MBQ1563089.1 hypothetical protein [Caulobacter sp.]